MDFNKYVSILNSDLCVLKGVGTKKSALFSKIGINTIADLIYYFPRTYEDRTVFYNVSSAPDDVFCCIKAKTISRILEKKIKKNISLYILKAEDDTGVISVKWFSSPYNRLNISVGHEYIFYGKISNDKNKEMDMRVIEPIGEQKNTGCIVPVYSTTSGLTQNDIRKAVKNALFLVNEIFETMPKNILHRNKLVDKNTAIKTMHNPDSFEAYKIARRRLAYEELFILVLALAKIRKNTKTQTCIIPRNVNCAFDFTKSLPFELTDGQKKAVNDICADFAKGHPMSRLLQGDVGSGKTVVAAVAAYVMAKNKYQTAIMAPTEILANQHFETFKSFFENHNIKIELLTSSVKNKKEIAENLKNGTVDVVVGTHALLEEYVEFSSLGLCITDEQHRFGVKQRSKLTHNEKYPHVLVMSATPIPRTLSLILYGDLDVSVITSLPKGRKPIDTFCVNSTFSERIYNFMKNNIAEGHQCFVVCPLVEESEKIDANSSVTMYNNLSKIFGQKKVLLIHGKMSSVEKDNVMASFRNGDADVLVATTVIEVGIDVPNANIIVIENAERFGLSQLHQLRGRVGRGCNKSYCILITDNTSEETAQRMNIMCTAKDGFEVAQKDLELRGCGEFFGTRQHGLPELKIANLFTDIDIVNDVKTECDMIIKNDPELTFEEHLYIKKRIDDIFDTYGSVEILN